MPSHFKINYRNLKTVNLDIIKANISNIFTQTINTTEHLKYAIEQPHTSLTKEMDKQAPH